MAEDNQLNARHQSPYVISRYFTPFIYYNTGNHLKASKPDRSRPREQSSLGAGVQSQFQFFRKETKVSGMIALQPEGSATQPDFPTSVELHFNIDE